MIGETHPISTQKNREEKENSPRKGAAATIQAV
jgi:hypothetical protein